MKNEKLFVIILALTLGGLASCNAFGEEYMDPAELAALIEKGSSEYYLIDVRTASEFEEGHIPTAINIPYDVILENVPTTEKNAHIIVYCQSGRRSTVAQTTLENAGYTNVQNFGGIDRWTGELEP